MHSIETEIEAQAAVLEEKMKSNAVAVAKVKNIFDEVIKLPPPLASEYQRPPTMNAKEKKPKANRRTHRKFYIKKLEGSSNSQRSSHRIGSFNEESGENSRNEKSR